MKVNYFLIITICSLSLNAQVDISRSSVPLPNPDAPKIISIDTIYSLDQETAIRSSNDFESEMKIRLIEYEIIYHKDDSSKSRLYCVENGILINDIPYGAWMYIHGYSNGMIRKQSQKTTRYYFHGNEIFFDPEFTQSIEFDSSLKRANCSFIYSREAKDSTSLIISYWLDDSKKAMVTCKTANGNKIFEVDVEYLDEEFIMLFEGQYDRYIYSENNDNQ